MRGGFVACLASTDPSESRLESVVARLRWHAGELSTHRHGGLQIACLADDVHGPTVEISGGTLVLCHGAPPERLERLERHDRFAGIESNGESLRAIRDPMGEVPLFYRRVGDEFWLGTEIHPLLAIAPAEPDLEWLAAFVAAVEHPEMTGWVGIGRVLPGEIVEVDRGLRMSPWRYFVPRVGTRRPRPSSEEAARRFSDAIGLSGSARGGTRT
jgi:hypothetical protein